MYIVPDSTIRILKGIPLDPSYRNTLFFSDKNAQASYFLGQAGITFQAQSYQRVEKGRIRLEIKTDSIYDYNYLMFRNTAYGSKWFYAFIRSVDYVNDITSDVSYEIDVMQTWICDYDMTECYVEREHTDTDHIGEHIEPENLETGEYVMNDYAPIAGMNDMCVIIAVVDVDGGTDGTLYDGVYGSASLWVYLTADIGGINNKINEYQSKPDSVISIYMCPLFLVGSIPDNHRLPYGAGARKSNIVLQPVTSYDTLDGYKPANKKLYTYPYNFYHVDNASGQELSLRYEFFEGLKPAFEIIGTLTQPVTAVLRPASYKGVPGYSELGGYTTLNTESIQLAGYPICSWNVDSYQAWIAQNAVPMLTSGLIGGGMLAGGLLLGANPVTAGASVIGGVTNLLQSAYRASIASDISKGNFDNGGANVAGGKQQFYGGRCSISAQYARMIDDYFTMFGYACRNVKKPNRNVRLHYTYVKTAGCTILGDVPADDEEKICSIYDNGITFWRHGNEVGNYSLDNSVN